MTWRSWKRRVVARRPGLRPPIPPDPSGLAEARHAAREAADNLRQTLAQTPAVEERARRAERIHRENHLGPSIWRVMEGRKA